MITKKCLGCGIELQCEDKDKEGFVPEEKLLMQENLLCQRCYKIKNYGQNLKNNFSKKDYEKEVLQSVKKSDIILPIFDIIDFEGSFTDEVLDYLRDYNSIVLINKIDLLPDFIHPTEISNWVKNRLSEEGIVPMDIAFISVKSKYGVNGIIRKINNIFKNKKVRATILGVSNVGKSSIINLLLKDNRITTSKYSGTTLKSINNKIPGTQITIIDTPGLIPVGRVSDLISVESGLKLVPAGEISRKTFKLEENQVFMFDVFCRFKILTSDSESKPIFSAYGSKNVKFHVARQERVSELIKGDFFQILSKEEKEKYFENEFVTKIVEVKENEELVVAGLGWINVKRGILKIEIVYPKAVKVVVREAIFKSKKI
ncbi:ribosome biogenesis GTPase YqeH [Leptotrichia sp. oral taxon 847]|uniref:ribosome biogenesis GTPase YqeH n=1 Tax=Leptotrichia sp. oral taxon 847 TaxID=1785996 RepID=UPI000767F211|nr:ribosome biogenesis GTPase YqeH [Leptotrichia sp. oral taxon 847]AMD94334.1 ribosome biogenesis GTPase YqeH [Leptotrichia sp. oral taxon 847]